MSRLPDTRATDPTQSIEGSLQHLGLIHAKRQQIEARQVAAEEQVAHRIAVEYRRGSLDRDDVLALYERFRECGSAGFGGRWTAAMPPELSCDRMRALLTSRRFSAPTAANGSDGSWHGQRLISPDDTRPPHGASVVYVLYDEAWKPCYVGSTQYFRLRMKSHVKDGKAFSFWRAWPCNDRAHAYQREGEMLNEVMPHLNRRREGRRSA
jgi:hypothetical protein